jgi:hypothetical protein
MVHLRLISCRGELGTTPPQVNVFLPENSATRPGGEFLSSAGPPLLQRSLAAEERENTGGPFKTPLRWQYVS